MVFSNHIATRFLTDDNFIMEIIEEMNDNEWKIALNGGEISEKIHSLYAMLCSKNQKSYYVTNSVLGQLDMLKINKKGEHFDWTIFDDVIPDCRRTFIFPDNRLLRLVVQKEMMFFCDLSFNLKDRKSGQGTSHWVLFYLNRKTGELCEHFGHQDVKSIEEFYYKFLCFMYLTENDEEVILAGKTYGTRKTGKILNSLPLPVTIVNSRWNTTTIRTEQFGVRGHFRVQPCGKARSKYEVIFIEPFLKNGYKRTAGKILENN